MADSNLDDAGLSRSMLLWLESGGVVAIPNLRGGGEYGESWHQGGMLAASRIPSTTSSRGRMAHRGGLDQLAAPRRTRRSNGGLLMGAALTQRPDLFRAVVVQVPLLDMLRYHRFRSPGCGYRNTARPMMQNSSSGCRRTRRITTCSTAWHTGGPHRHGRERHARRSAARAEDDGPSPAGHLIPSSGAAAARVARRPRAKPLAKVLDELTDT
jgi:hypothetical protein